MNVPKLHCLNHQSITHFAGLTHPQQLDLQQLGDELGLGPYPGDMERLFLVTGSIMPFDRTASATPELAAELAAAIEAMPGALCGLLALEVNEGLTACLHGQYAYFFQPPMEEGKPAALGVFLAHEVESSLWRVWRTRGSCLLNAGHSLAWARGCSDALELAEYLFVYPLKCHVHLRGDQLGLGLGLCTLGMTREAVAAALSFTRCPELESACLLGTNCKKHDHCLPRFFAGSVNEFAESVKHVLALFPGLSLAEALEAAGKAAKSLCCAAMGASAVPAQMAAARAALGAGTSKEEVETESRRRHMAAAGTSAVPAQMAVARAALGAGASKEEVEQLSHRLALAIRKGTSLSQMAVGTFRCQLRDSSKADSSCGVTARRVVVLTGEVAKEGFEAVRYSCKTCRKQVKRRVDERLLMKLSELVVEE